jgi:hypothetical protein
MDRVREFLNELKQQEQVQGHFMGMVHVLIGRRIALADGTPVAEGLTWRAVAGLLKRVRWDPEVVRELGLDPATLPPRDRERFWYSAISRAGVDSPAAVEAGDRFAELLAVLGYVVTPERAG